MTEVTEATGDEAGDEAADAADTTEESPPTPTSRARLVVVVAILAGTLLTGLFAFGATRYSAVHRQLDNIDGVRKVAGDFGAATLTYDYRDLKPFERRMRANATGSFKRQLTDGLPGLEALITQLKSVSEATVKQVYVSDVEAHSASALVVVEARAKNGDAPERTLDAAYVELELVKAGGRWLVAGVSTLDLGQGSAAAALPNAGTTTTVPSK
jgi:hypothetical protein